MSGHCILILLLKLRFEIGSSENPLKLPGLVRIFVSLHFRLATGQRGLCVSKTNTTIIVHWTSCSLRRYMDAEFCPLALLLRHVRWFSMEFRSPSMGAVNTTVLQEAMTATSAKQNWCWDALPSNHHKVGFNKVAGSQKFWWY